MESMEYTYICVYLCDCMYVLIGRSQVITEANKPHERLSTKYKVKEAGFTGQGNYNCNLGMFRGLPSRKSTL